MPKSTSMIANMTSVVSSGPAAVTKANSIAAAGPILDYAGVSALCLLALEEAGIVLAAMKTDLDSGDSNLTIVNALIDLLNGTGSPSTQALTDAQTLATTAFSAASNALAIAPAGPIMDLVGMANKVWKNLQELVSPLTYLHTNTDNGTDGTNRTLLANLLLVLV